MMAKNSALELLDFFEALWANDTDGERVSAQPMNQIVDHALDTSLALRELEAVKPGWMRKWVEEWAAVRK